MKTKSVIALVLCSLPVLAFLPGRHGTPEPIYLNPAYSFEERAADLVSRMTPAEKQSQLGNTMPAIPRLGVNKYDVWGEALHGVMGRNNNAGMTATSFPNSVAIGSTWAHYPAPSTCWWKRTTSRGPPAASTCRRQSRGITVSS